MTISEKINKLKEAYDEFIQESIKEHKNKTTINGFIFVTQGKNKKLTVYSSPENCFLKYKYCLAVNEKKCNLFSIGVSKDILFLRYKDSNVTLLDDFALEKQTTINDKTDYFNAALESEITLSYEDYLKCVDFCFDSDTKKSLFLDDL